MMILSRPNLTFKCKSAIANKNKSIKQQELKVYEAFFKSSQWPLVKDFNRSLSDFSQSMTGDRLLFRALLVLGFLHLDSPVDVIFFQESWTFVTYIKVY